MAVIAICGDAGCREEETARLTAQSLPAEYIGPARLERLLQEAFGSDPAKLDRAYPAAMASVVAGLAADHHLVLCGSGVEHVADWLPRTLRVRIVAPVERRVGVLMLERRLERPAAQELLESLDAQDRRERRQRFGRAARTPVEFDLTMNAATLETEQMAELIAAAVGLRGLREEGLLPAAAVAQTQFQTRLQLARHGVSPLADIALPRRVFGHPSEEIFANLLDFYRIGWEYEPRSFPIQWAEDGRITEAFTPDFYLPEFDQYVELTTMKQANVTRKNRKVKLLRELYPEINIQVFYQKDFENLIFKYGLAGGAVQA